MLIPFPEEIQDIVKDEYDSDGNNHRYVLPPNATEHQKKLLEDYEKAIKEPTIKISIGIKK